MTELDPLQLKQDEEYAFPYHYVVKGGDGRFSQCFNDTWGINYLATIEYLLGRLDHESFRSVADVGCGDGRFTRELALRFPGRTVAGIDYSPRAIALAQAMSPGLDFRCLDIVGETVGDTFDAAVLMEVYEHIPPHLAPAFREALARLIAPGGILYLTVPHLNKPVEYKHFRHFDAATLLEEFSAGFEPLELVFIEKRSRRKRFIDAVLTNRFFILNNAALGNRLYRYYKSELFLAGDEPSCQRVFLRARRRQR